MPEITETNKLEKFMGQVHSSFHKKICQSVQPNSQRGCKYFIKTMKRITETVVTKLSPQSVSPHMHMKSSPSMGKEHMHLYKKNSIIICCFT